MRSTNDEIHNPDEVKEVRQAGVEKKITHIGYLKPHKGHKIWEFNTKTGHIAIAEMESVPHNPFTKGRSGLPEGPKKKLITKENCVYVSAMNIENAVKKFGLKVKVVKTKAKKK